MTATYNSGNAILQLTVRNHPGVMSHICGLFARRSYNMEAILCLPLADRRYSQVWLLLDEDARLEQVMRQTQKLVDVIDVRRHDGAVDIFPRLRTVVGE